MNENEEKNLSENNVDTKPEQEVKSTENDVESSQTQETDSQDNKTEEEPTQENSSPEEHQEPKNDAPTETTTTNNNKKNSSNTTKIILIIVIALLVFAMIGTFVIVKVVMPKLTTKQTNENIIGNILDTIDETKSEIDGARENNNNSSGSDQAQEIIDRASEIITDGQNSMKVEMYNSDLEEYVGTQDGDDVQELLDEIIMKLKKDTTRLITVSYNNNDTSDTNELTNIKHQIDVNKQYEVSMDYDTDGYINVITIKNI